MMNEKTAILKVLSVFDVSLPTPAQVQWFNKVDSLSKHHREIGNEGCVIKNRPEQQLLIIFIRSNNRLEKNTPANRLVSTMLYRT